MQATVLPHVAFRSTSRSVLAAEPRLIAGVGRQTVSVDRPMLLADPSAVAARMKQLREPHIEPLTAFVERLREEAGPGASIPYFDPWDGGIAATTLFLLEAPGAKAVGSGFVSRNNPDQTAKNFFQLCTAAGLPRKSAVAWNVVPWYIGTGTRIRAATPKDLEAGLRPLPRLLALLPNLQAVVLLGRKAEAAARHLPHGAYSVFKCPHPSPLYVNNAPGNRGKILAALMQVRAAVVQPAVPADGYAPGQ